MISPSPPTSTSSDDPRLPGRCGTRAPSFSCSASSFSGSPSSSSASRSNSPFLGLPLSSAVPFSWERQPGIPKSPSTAAFAVPASKDHLLLPLPPPARSTGGNSRKKRPDTSGVDPFAAALTECAKDPAPIASDDLDAFWRRHTAAKPLGIWRLATIADRLGLVGAYASCKSSCSVSHSAVVLPRSTLRAATSFDLRIRRSG